VSTIDGPGHRADPRIERTREVVRRVALSELAAVGYGAFSIEAVARRSGVAKSTIYRHWRGKLALIADALDTLNVQTPAGALPAEATPRERVEQLLEHLADAFGDPVITGCTPALIEASEHDAEVRAFHHAYASARRKALVEAIAQGVRDGSFPAGVDPDIAATAMAGTIVYRRVMTDTPFRRDDVPALIEALLGARTGAGSSA
jgi:TetR/AcrR family transcriptional regulator, regulator of autoinduction and epiphytic fitness